MAGWEKSCWDTEVFGYPTVAVASDIYRTNPLVAHQHHIGRGRSCQAKDNSSHMVRRETQRCLNGLAPNHIISHYIIIYGINEYSMSNENMPKQLHCLDIIFIITQFG